MKKEMQKMLREAFAAPEPIHKREFLSGISVPSVHILEFLGYQIRYIRKWIWGVDFLALAVVLAVVSAADFVTDAKLLGVISALMPVLAVTIVIEMGRSETFSMAEFEQSARFSLRSVTLARLGILGIVNLLVFAGMLLIGRSYRNLSFVRTGVYALCPYLITVFCGLWITRKIHAKEAGYLCAGAAVLVSFAAGMLPEAMTALYEESFFYRWAAALIAAAFGAVRECIKTVKQTEVSEWS